MRAGVSKVCITPPVGTWQGGYGARRHPSVGVHDDLFARALVLAGDDGAPAGAVVAVDISGLSHDLADAARRRAGRATGIPAGSIALCASHTHGGPATRGFVGRDEGAGGRGLPAPAGEVPGRRGGAAAARELQPVAVHLGRARPASTSTAGCAPPRGR